MDPSGAELAQWLDGTANARRATVSPHSLVAAECAVFSLRSREETVSASARFFPRRRRGRRGAGGARGAGRGARGAHADKA